MKITLQDPVSGSPVEIRQAQLPQRCGICTAQLEGQVIVNVVHSGRGWVCFDHTERLLMSLPMSQELSNRIAAQVSLAGVMPGDQIVATRQMLAALGVA